MNNDEPNGNDSLLKLLLASQKEQQEQQQACAALLKSSTELRTVFEQEQRVLPLATEHRLAKIEQDILSLACRLTSLEEEKPQLERALQLALESSVQLDKSVQRRSPR